MPNELSLEKLAAMSHADLLAHDEEYRLAIVSLYRRRRVVRMMLAARTKVDAHTKKQDEAVESHAA